MGDMADYYLELDMKKRVEDNPFETLVGFSNILNHDYWVTKEGVKKYPKKNMTYSHILNVQRMLKQESFLSNHQKANVLFYLMVPGPSGEFAQDCFDMEFNHALEVSNYPLDRYFAEIVEPSTLWQALEAGKAKHQKKQAKVEPNFPWIVSN
jgi:hypothetical protein